MQSLLVYLDSSDYSTLSDPKRRTAQIVCCYSGTHLSEMAPIEPTYSDAAERRADMMVELCGRNTLISQDRLINWEVSHALGSAIAQPHVLSSTGNWYPDGLPDVMAEIKISLSASIEETIADSSLNRSGRREAKRKLLKGSKVRAGFKIALTQSARADSIEAILGSYPMREQDARVLSRWIVGDATLADATEAFAESLRDPRWMMKWFREHHEVLSPFIDRARAPMRPVIDSLMKMASIGALLAELDKASGTDLYSVLLSRNRWLAVSVQSSRLDTQ